MVKKILLGVGGLVMFIVIVSFAVFVLRFKGDIQNTDASGDRDFVDIGGARRSISLKGALGTPCS